MQKKLTIVFNLRLTNKQASFIGIFMLFLIFKHKKLLKNG